MLTDLFPRYQGQGKPVAECQLELQSAPAQISFKFEKASLNSSPHLTFSLMTMSNFKFLFNWPKFLFASENLARIIFGCLGIWQKCKKLQTCNSGILNTKHI